MAERLTIWNVVIDGIDKTGKDTIVQYVWRLSKKRYECHARGVLSMIAYAELFNRNVRYNLYREHNVLNVRLTVDKDDWKIRCAVTKEPEIDYDAHTKAFDFAEQILTSHNIPVLTYNTSHCTPYEIAQDIVARLDEINAYQNAKYDREVFRK